MRKIKFRAWDGKNMYSWSSIKEWGNFYSQEKLNVMQFTGLKDKNGKEIYEGDIIICRDGKFVIEYEESFAQFIMTNKDLIRTPDQFGEQDADTCMRSIEIIGNKFENPELLETKK